MNNPATDPRTIDQVLAQVRTVAGLTPFGDPGHPPAAATWRQALFAADGSLARADDPDRQLLAALVAEYPQLDRHAVTLHERAHLHWLEQILAVPRLPVLPDTVVAQATVDPKLAPVVLARGTLLRGGKDAVGAERQYRTDEPLTAHGATLAGVRTLVPGGPAPALPGLVAEAPAGDGPGFPLDPHAGTPAVHLLRLYSPVLRFDSGSMTVRVTLAGAGSAAGLAPATWHHLRADGDVGETTGSVSGETVTVVLDGGGLAEADGGGWLEARIPAGSDVPVALSFQRARLTVIDREVTPQAGFLNDGVLDLSKEFQPFGAVAKRGDALYLRSDEALSKPLSALTVTVEVMQESGALLSSSAGGSGVPSYLQVAVDEEIHILRSNADITVSSEVWASVARIQSYLATENSPRVLWQRRDPEGWATLATVEGAFSGFSRTGLGGVSSQRSAFGGEAGHTIRAFLAEGDFGWTDYQISLADFATKAAARTGPAPTMAPPPVPPVCSRITLRYSTIPVDAARVEARNGWATQVKPSTSTAFHPFDRAVSARGDTGMVAIGLSFPERTAATVGGTGVSLFLDVDSAAPCDSTEDPDARWEWWDGTRWVPLPVADGSSLLREPGLLRFVAPRGWASGSGDLAATDGRWIRMVTRTPERIGGLRAVVPDAVTASYLSGSPDPGADPSVREALPPGTIKGTVTRVPGVKKVTNLAAVPGRGPEADPSYRRRASGLTRHRGRALTAWDYEELVRVGFPEVAAVRCLPHTAADGARRAGSVGLVVLPDRPGTAAPRPSVSLSGRIGDALAPSLPIHARVAVMCPLYVPATVEAAITLRPGIAGLTGLSEITATLESWLHPLGSDPIRWGRSLYRSSLEAFLDRLWWVTTLDSLVLRGPDGAPAQALAVDACRGLYCSSAGHRLDVSEQL